jgi:hypothetical protein
LKSTAQTLWQTGMAFAARRSGPTKSARRDREDASNLWSVPGWRCSYCAYRLILDPRIVAAEATRFDAVIGCGGINP